MVYFNVEKDETGAFGENIVLISSSETKLEDDLTVKERKTIPDFLKEELDNVYSISEEDEKDITEDVINVLLRKKMLRAPKLSLFVADEAEVEKTETVKKVEESVKVFTCPCCGEEYTQSEITTRILEEGENGVFTCDFCNEEIKLSEIIDLVELNEGEFICPECGTITEKHICPSCGYVLKEEAEVLEESEPAEEETAEPKTEEKEVVMPVTPTASTAILSPKGPIEIKDWNDLKTAELVFSFLVNVRKKIGTENFCTHFSEFLGNDAVFTNDSILKCLKDNGIIEESTYILYTNSFYSKSMNLKKEEAVNSIEDVLIVLNRGLLTIALEDMYTKINEELTLNSEVYADILTYWLAMASIEVKNGAKSIMKECLSIFDKDTSLDSSELFKFDLLEVGPEIEKPKSFYVLAPVASSSISETVSASEELCYGIITRMLPEIDVEVTSGSDKVSLPNKSVYYVYVVNAKSYKDTKDTSLVYDLAVEKALSLRGLIEVKEGLFEARNAYSLGDVCFLCKGIDNFNHETELDKVLK